MSEAWYTPCLYIGAPGRGGGGSVRASYSCLSGPAPAGSPLVVRQVLSAASSTWALLWLRPWGKLRA